MKRSLMIFLGIVGVVGGLQAADLRMPARQISVDTNGPASSWWINIRAKDTNAQTAFNWIDTNWLSYQAWIISNKFINATNARNIDLFARSLKVWAAPSNLVIQGGVYPATNGANTNIYGLVFVATNSTTGKTNTYAGIIAKATQIAGTQETSELYFMMNDQSFTFTPISIDADGRLVIDPSRQTFTTRASLYGERLSVIDGDGISQYPLSVRHLGADVTNLSQYVGMTYGGYNSATSEIVMASERASFNTRTSGSEETRLTWAVRRAAYNDDGPIVEGDNDGVSGNSYAVNKLFGYRDKLVKVGTNYSLAELDAACTIMNYGATNTVTFTLPDIDACGNLYPFNFVNGFTWLNDASNTYQWTKSTSGTHTNVYYVRTTAGANPTLADPTYLYYRNQAQTKVTLPVTAAGQWGYGDADSLGYNTVYVKLSSGDVDPDGDSLVAISYPYTVRTYNSGTHAIVGPGTTNAQFSVTSDGKLGSQSTLKSVDKVDGWFGDWDWASASAVDEVQSYISGCQPVYSSPTVVTIGPGDGVCNGSYFAITNATNFTVAVSPTNDHIEYILLDDSATVYPTAVAFARATNVTLDGAKGGYYNGNDRCLAAIQTTNGSIVAFSGDDGWVFPIPTATNSTREWHILGFASDGSSTWAQPTNVITDIPIESSDRLPTNAVAARFLFIGDWDDGEASMFSVAPKEMVDAGLGTSVGDDAWYSSAQLIRTTTAAASAGLNVTFDVILGPSRKIRYHNGGTAADSGSVYINVLGWKIVR